MADTSNRRLSIARIISTKLDGHHTEVGDYGNTELSARVWSKGKAVRVYVDARYISRDGTIDTRLRGNGYIDVLERGVAYALNNDGNEIRSLVEDIIA